MSGGRAMMTARHMFQVVLCALIPAVSTFMPPIVVRTGKLHRGTQTMIQHSMRISSSASTSGSHHDVLIVGGGLGGVATALALKELAGISDVKIWERADVKRWERAGSVTGLGISANGLRAIETISPSVHAQVMAAGVYNDKLERQYIRWRTLRNILASHLPPDTIVFGADVAALATSSDAVRVTSSAGKDNKAPQTAEAAVVVAADGLRSVIKRLLVRSTSVQRQTDADDGFLVRELTTNVDMSLRSLGRTNIRGVLDGVEGEEQRGEQVQWQAVKGGQMAKITISPTGDAYWSLSLLDSDADRFGWDQAKVLASASHAKTEAMRLNAEYPELRALVEATPETEVIPYVSMVGSMVESMAEGRVALLGDAAHPAAVTGEGANMVLEDAVALALAVARSKELQQARETSGSIMNLEGSAMPKVLQAWSDIRLPICTLIADISLRSADAWMQQRGDLAVELGRLRPPFDPEATPESVVAEVTARREKLAELLGRMEGQ